MNLPKSCTLAIACPRGIPTTKTSHSHDGNECRMRAAGGRRPTPSAFIGAAGGGAVTAAAEGNRTGFAYTEQLNDGSLLSPIAPTNVRVPVPEQPHARHLPDQADGRRRCFLAVQPARSLTANVPRTSMRSSGESRDGRT